VRADSHHVRRIAVSPETVGGLLDTLASREDALWPWEHWPAMRLRPGLAVGADGGHAFIRYTVATYVPSRSVRFTITGPAGFSGYHEFTVSGDGAGTLLEHRIIGRARGLFVPAWFCAVRPLHNALMTDCLGKAESAATGVAANRARWSPWVRFLRRVMARRA
jgi:hypothetical protein